MIHLSHVPVPRSQIPGKIKQPVLTAELPSSGFRLIFQMSNVLEISIIALCSGRHKNVAPLDPSLFVSRYRPIALEDKINRECPSAGS